MGVHVLHEVHDPDVQITVVRVSALLCDQDSRRLLIHEENVEERPVGLKTHVHVFGNLVLPADREHVLNQWTRKRPPPPNLGGMNRLNPQGRIRKKSVPFRITVPPVGTSAAARNASVCPEPEAMTLMMLEPAAIVGTNCV